MWKILSDIFQVFVQKAEELPCFPCVPCVPLG